MYEKMEASSHRHGRIHQRPSELPSIITRFALEPKLTGRIKGTEMVEFLNPEIIPDCFIDPFCSKDMEGKPTDIILEGYLPRKKHWCTEIMTLTVCSDDFGHHYWLPKENWGLNTYRSS